MRHAVASVFAPLTLCGLASSTFDVREGELVAAEVVGDTVLELIHCTECYERAKGLGVMPYSEWLDELRSQESYRR